MSDFADQVAEQFDPQLLYAVKIYGEFGTLTEFKTNRSEVQRLMKAWSRLRFLRHNFNCQTTGNNTNYLTVDLRRVLVIECILIRDEIAQPTHASPETPAVPAVKPQAGIGSNA